MWEQELQAHFPFLFYYASKHRHSYKMIWEPRGQTNQVSERWGPFGKGFTTEQYTWSVSWRRNRNFPRGLEGEKGKNGSLAETLQNRIVKKRDEIKELQKYF